MVNQVISYIHNTFALKDLGELHYFLGIQVTKTEKGIHLSQAKYITYLLAKHNIDKCSPCATLMIASYHLTRNTRPTLDNASQYRSVIGAL